MGLILDSSVVISAERFGRTAYQMIEVLGSEHHDAEMAVSVITVLELAHGVARGNTEQRRSSRQKFLDDLLTGMPVRAVTVPIALRAGQIDGRLQSSGIRIALVRVNYFL